VTTESARDTHPAGLPAGLERALVIAAHPDDIECFAGGTIARLTRTGAVVVYALATGGEGGCNDMSVPTPAVTAQRKREQRQAAQLLGVETVEWITVSGGAMLRDSEVIPSLDLRLALVRLIRHHRPDLVVTFDPTCLTMGSYVNHPDHRAVGESVIAAVWPAAANPRYHSELLDAGLAPHAVRELWLMLSPTPNHAVDISSTLDPKAAALAAHKSQLPDDESVRSRVWRDAEHDGALSQYEFAERFHRVQINARTENAGGGSSSHQ
jgi:LmbE family N-acetylglucosaminyl deacetylase